LDVIEYLKEQFNEIIYLIAQEQQSQHGIENKNDEVLKVGQRSHDLLHSSLLKDEVLIITKNDIIEFNESQTMY
jgi:hypothetical protein